MKFILSLLTTLILIYLLDNSWVINGNRVPPLGKFLDPFQGFWQNAEPTDVTAPETLTLTGLKSAVTVVYDSLLIPHLFAEYDEDLYLAQGYITASHRLWQMEFQLLASAGRITSDIGPGKVIVLLVLDRNHRITAIIYDQK